MFRFVFLASLGVLALKPAFGDEPLSATTAPALTPAVTPASAIARSEFALAERDVIRAKTVIAKPVLQASIPLGVKGKVGIDATVPRRPTATIAAKPSPLAVGMVSTRRIPLTKPFDLPSANRVPASGARVTSAQIKAGTGSVPASPKSSGTLLAALPSSDSNTPLQVEPPVSHALRPGPKVLSSREMRRLRSYVVTLDGEQANLNRAQSRLTQCQQRLGVFTSVLNTAMLKNGDEGNGLNPFVRVAIRYRGTPYVWAGTSGRGFDCSGFIIRVMQDLGYPALPHSAAEQINYGMPVARELLKPGDIVFFKNTYKAGVSHVGIYLGQRQFIHAANSKVGTIVSSIDEPKWIEHYAGARRLLITRS